MISQHVAVIGAGASGLVAARELRREGHTVVVFERGDQVGGVWIYTPDLETDPLGLDPNRTVIHCSLYNSLRTNLPREVMGFRDYPFVAKEGDPERDPRRFPGHKEVLMYLKDFAKEFEIEELVRFETEVTEVKLMVEIGKWKVTTKRKRGGFCGHELFEAVVVCAGHYWDPLIAEIPGIDSWPGKQMHSHNYRTPDSFQDKVVILVGSSASANDISRELAGVAKEVHVACRSPGFFCLDTSFDHERVPKLPGYNNIWIHSMIKTAHENGTVVFQDGSTIFADFILHCTGYKYHFPFLGTNGIVTIHDNRVGPLYKHVFPPILAPHLSFVGLPWRAVPFPLFELQSKWIAGALSNRIVLPSPENMMEDVKAFYASLEASGKRIQDTHNSSSYHFEYIDWLVNECKAPSHEEWRKEMTIATLINAIARPESFRDECDDHDQHLVLQAREDFIKHLK